MTCSPVAYREVKKKTRFERVFCFSLSLSDISLCSSYLIGYAAAAEAKKSRSVPILPEPSDLRHETKYKTKRPL
jgi:hypothetical protein